jgi:hypothetical protein
VTEQFSRSGVKLEKMKAGRRLNVGPPGKYDAASFLGRIELTGPQTSSEDLVRALEEKFGIVIPEM